MRKISYLFFILVTTKAFSFGESRIISSPRSLLMGDAFTSFANDEYTLFYNPALLARHSGFSFSPLNPKMSATNPLGDPDRFKDLPDEPVDVYDRISGYPIHIGMEYAPGFKMGRFGMNLIYNKKADLMLMNNVSPKLYVNEKYDKGFIAGYAHPFWGRYSHKSGGEQLAFGFSVKYINREGLDGSFALTSPTILDALDEGDINSVLKKLGEAKGSGWGGDVGFDYVKRTGNSTFSTSISFLDPITKIHTEKNEEGTVVPDETFKTNLGFAFEQNFNPLFGYSISADIHELNNQDLDFRRKFKMGVSLGNKALRLMGGVNSGYFSYGLGAKLVLLNIFAGFYDVESGVQYQQVRSNRFFIYLSLFDFTFDA